jgi:hypothetical protein
MNICKKKDKFFTELYLKKKTADMQWERILLEALHGNIKQDEIAWAMEQCNVADWNLIEFEIMNNKIKRGQKGYDDKEFFRKYIEPYSKSRA